MNAPPKIRPEEIKGIFPLLTVFLIIVESLFGYWLFRADNMDEREIVGIIMTLIFMSFLIVALKVKQADVRRSTTTEERIRSDDPKVVSEIISLKDKQIENLKESEDELRKLKPEYDRLKRSVNDIMPDLDPVLKGKLAELLLR